MLELKTKINSQKEAILDWFLTSAASECLPFYLSVDIRESLSKMAVIDTNIYPAGFNNLCKEGLKDSVPFIRDILENRVDSPTDILLISEEHTRNTWYLENIYVLKSLLEDTGCRVSVSTFLGDDQPNVCDEEGFLTVTTATGQDLTVYCLKWIIRELTAQRLSFDTIILNNDLTLGIPATLRGFNIPIYPSPKLGWHTRTKSTHFSFLNSLTTDFCSQFLPGVDPWFLSTLFSSVSGDVSLPADRDSLQDHASDLFRQIRAKYREHGFSEDPYIVLKANFGTYGMGVLPIHDPSDIGTLNRRNRNKLSVGKGGKLINNFLLQEGIPTHTADGLSKELVSYLCADHYLGSFYRCHSKKGNRDNLNAKGMTFMPICSSPTHKQCCLNDLLTTTLSEDAQFMPIVLARLASASAYREGVQLDLEGSS